MFLRRSSQSERDSNSLGLRLSPVARTDLLQHLAAVLEMQLNHLAEIEAAQAQTVEVGITEESFDALATVTFRVPRHDIDTLHALSVAELKRLVSVHTRTQMHIMGTHNGPVACRW